MKTFIRYLVAGAAGVATNVLPAQTALYAPTNAPRAVRFANPCAQDRILPIHHTRGNDPSHHDGELAELAADGFGGLATNVSFDKYLDDPAGWDALRSIVARAQQKGFALWLYDEQGYPSATAGGKTLADHPEWQARAYLVAVTNVPAGSAALPPSPPGKPVATLRRRAADGKTDTVFVVTDDYIHDGTHISVSVSAYKYPYPNLLLKEPTARFIELTHEAYRRELGPHLNLFTSTFTDEPSLMTYWMRPMPYVCLPVSDDLLAEYLALGHTSVADDIPDLVQGEPVGAVAAKRHRFWSLVGARVARNYTGQLTDWASKNGLASGGHLLMEEHIAGHVPLYGDFFRVLRGLSAPSCDILTSVPEEVPYVTPLLVGSAAELNGNAYVMSEASDFCQTYRPQGDTRPKYQVSAREVIGALNRQIWGGVNTFTSYYGWERFSRDDRRAINTEIGRTLTLTREGRSAAEIAILYPSDSLMTGFEPARLGAGGAAGIRTAGLFTSVGQALFDANRAFLIVDDDTLAAAKIEDGCLVQGPLRWRTVILAGVTTLPTDVARKLTAFQLAGGLVLAVGDSPVNSTRLFPDAEIYHLANTWTFLSEDLIPFLGDFLALRHKPALVCAHGDATALRTSHRRLVETTAGRVATNDIFFVMNDTPEAWSGTVRLARDVPRQVWDPRTGTVPAEITGDSPLKPGDCPLSLPPYGAAVITTKETVEGQVVRRRGLSPALKRGLSPLPVPPSSCGFGKGEFVAGGETALADGRHEIDVTLTKGHVDTFAFLAFNYAEPPLPATARGLAFHVEVLAADGGTAHGGCFLTTRDGQRWYNQGLVPLSATGTTDASFAFASFAPFDLKPDQKRPRLKPAEIVRVEFGFGGYYGREGEHIHFTVSPPSELKIEIED